MKTSITILIVLFQFQVSAQNIFGPLIQKLQSKDFVSNYPSDGLEWHKIGRMDLLFANDALLNYSQKPLSPFNQGIIANILSSCFANLEKIVFQSTKDKNVNNYYYPFEYIYIAKTDDAFTTKDAYLNYDRYNSYLIIKYSIHPNGIVDSWTKDEVNKLCNYDKLISLDSRYVTWWTLK